MIFIIIWGLIVWWTYSIAKKKGYDTGLAILAGIMFGIFAVIGYAIAEDKKVKEINK